MVRSVTLPPKVPTRTVTAAMRRSATAAMSTNCEGGLRVICTDMLACPPDGRAKHDPLATPRESAGPHDSACSTQPKRSRSWLGRDVSCCWPSTATALCVRISKTATARPPWSC
jgi:hypothetical protein